MCPVKVIERTRTLNLADFLTKDITMTKANKGTGIGLADSEDFTLLGEYIVPPQQRLAIGIRPDFLNPLVGGIFHVELHTVAPADIEGEVKIRFRNASDTISKTIIKRMTTSMWKTAPSDRSKQVLVRMGVNIPITWCREDSVVQLFFKPLTDGIILDWDNALNIIHIDVTTINPNEGRTELI